MSKYSTIKLRFFQIFRIPRFCLFCNFYSNFFLYLFLRLFVRVFLLLQVLWSQFPLFLLLLFVFRLGCLLGVLVVDLWFLRWVCWYWSGIHRRILLFLLVFVLFLVLRHVLFLLVGLIGYVAIKVLFDYGSSSSAKFFDV